MGNSISNLAWSTAESTNDRDHDHGTSADAAAGADGAPVVSSLTADYYHINKQGTAAAAIVVLDADTDATTGKSQSDENKRAALMMASASTSASSDRVIVELGQSSTLTSDLVQTAATAAKVDNVVQTATAPESLDAQHVAEIDAETKSNMPTTLSTVAPPLLSSLDEVLTTSGDAIIQYAAMRPNDDTIIVVEKSGAIVCPTLRALLVSGYSRVASCVAGSAAVRELQTRLTERARQLGLEEAAVFRSAKMRAKSKWQPNDCDVFVLGQSRSARFKLQETDMVHVPERTISSLLLGFDLPCCRAAIDVEGRIWCSMHCLAALLSGRYTLPKLLTTEKGCLELIERAHQQYIVYEKPCAQIGVVRSDDKKAQDAHFVHKRIKERTAKYASDRGIEACFDYEGTPVPRWIHIRYVKRFEMYAGASSDAVAAAKTSLHENAEADG